MKRNNKKECPSCKSKEIFDSCSRVSETAQTVIPGKPIAMPTVVIYRCTDCDERFILVDGYVCPECNSDQVKKSGPFAVLKREGEPATKGPSPIHLHCWDCKHDWEEVS